MKLINYIEKYIEDNNITKKYYLDSLNTLVMYYYNIELNKLVLRLKEEISEDDSINLNKLFDKLVKENLPVEYITNIKYFYNEKYYVDENVLIPRDDTEILVSKAISLIEKYKLKTLLDMCCGSGCIGISVCNNSSVQKAFFVDISKKALEIASKNITLNNCKKNISTLNSDLFKDIDKNIKFDIILSNPPYIKKQVIASLDEAVKKEPLIALDGGNTGLDIYERIVNDVDKYLNDGGFLLFEIGYDQKQDLINIINSNNNFEYIDCIKDYFGNDRVIICRFHQM